MTGRLFGTDGVRGVANRELTPELALALGRAAGHRLGGAGHGVIIGRDTRRSGRMLESALAAGLCSVGMEVWLAGVIPTPGLAFLARLPEYVAGAVISASHNPAPDNGIKFFDHQGLKLPDAVEDEIERSLDPGDPAPARPPVNDVGGLAHDERRSRWSPGDGLPRPTEAGIGRVGDRRDLVDLYVGWLIARAPALAGARVVLDCANGATYRVAPKVLRGAGAEVETLFAQPDGTNINLGCGATAPEALAANVVERGGGWAGFAFDGDGDRVIAVDETGAIRDGDVLIGILALDLKRRGELEGDRVIGTVMTNGGLVETLRRAGITVDRAQVGDKYIWERLVGEDAVLGGEPSGHVILRSLSNAGDGILTALRVLAVVREQGATLAELARQVEIWPQVTRNVRAARRAHWESEPRFVAAVREVEARLDGEGRLVVRPSGTEPLLRITVESRDAGVSASTADALAAAAEAYLS